MTPDDCPLCGEQAPPRARYCPQCGASLDTAVMPLSLVGSETASLATPPQQAKSPKGARLAVALGLAALAGLVGLAVLSGNGETSDADPDEAVPAVTAKPTETAEPTTTPLAEEQPLALQRTEPISWQQTGSKMGALPLGFGALDSSVYAFSSAQLDKLGRSVGLMSARSDDGGATWQALAEVIPAPAEIHQITSSAHSLLAAGVKGQQLMVWESTDGVVWEENPLASVDALQEIEVTALEAAGEQVVLFAETARDPFRQIAEAVAARPELEGADYSVGWTPSTVYALGPMSLVLASYTGADLGLDLYGLSQASQDPQHQAWLRAADRDWAEIDADIGEIERVGANGADGFRAIATEAGVPTTWESSDGLAWSQVDQDAAQALRWPWREHLLALSRWTDDGAFYEQSAGGDWQVLDIFSLLPKQTNWSMADVAVGAAAVAVAVNGTSAEIDQEKVVAFLAADDYLLEVDSEAWEIVLSQDDEVVSRVRLGLGSNTQPFAVDLQTNTVTFLAGLDGDPLVTVSVDDLRALEESAPRYFRGSRVPSRVLVSTDLMNWTNGRVDPSAEGAELSATHVFVTDSRVLALTMPHDVSDAEDAGAGIWVAPLPDN